MINQKGLTTTDESSMKAFTLFSHKEKAVILSMLK